MGTTFEGTAADRIARLKRRGRACVGQNGHCVNAAVDEFDVIPVVDGRPDTTAPVSTLKTCGRHRVVVTRDERVHVVEHRQQVLAHRFRA